jgi:hypothetical protein
VRGTSGNTWKYRIMARKKISERCDIVLHCPEHKDKLIYLQYELIVITFFRVPKYFEIN